MTDIAQPRNLVVVVIDRLQAGFLGAYGNAWIHTPNFDRLAAEGFLFDRATIDSPRLDLLYRSYWRGLHALSAPLPPGGDRIAEVVEEPPARDLPTLLQPRSDTVDSPERGRALILVTDEPWLAEHPLADRFTHFEQLLPSSGHRRAAAAEETDSARLIAAASEQLGRLSEPFCLWLHIGALGRRWDAPIEFGGQYGDEDDPLPPNSATVPNQQLPDDSDPDELLAHVHAYAGQVTLLDSYLGGLLDVLAEHPAASRTLLAVLSARGFPLGEHGRLGQCDEALYSELTQVPWILRLPDRRGASDRTQALVQPPDLHATLLDWCGLPPAQWGPPAARGRSLLPLVEESSMALRDRACIAGTPGESAIATPAWHQRMVGVPHVGRVSTASDPAPSVELFAKPDDRFEVNEVSNRASDVAAEMNAAFAQFEQACQSAAIAELPPLPESLVTGID